MAGRMLEPRSPTVGQGQLEEYVDQRRTRYIHAPLLARLGKPTEDIVYTVIEESSAYDDMHHERTHAKGINK